MKHFPANVYITPWNAGKTKEIVESPNLFGATICVNDMESSGWIKIGVASIEVMDVDFSNVVSAQAKAIALEIELEEKASATKIARLRMELSKLTCLENGGE